MMNVTFKLWEILLGVLIFIASVYVGYVVSGGSVARENVVEEGSIPKYTSREPIVSGFGSTLSPDFPSEIPVETGAQIVTSYNQDHFKYFSTAVTWESSKTIQENYDFYETFLLKNGWKIINKKDSKEISNLYATKDVRDINIVVTPSIATSSKSQMNISYTTQK